MKKIILTALIILSSSLAYSEDFSYLDSDGKSSKDISLESIDKKLEGKTKLGVALGTVSGITLGYQVTEIIELNAVIDIFSFENFKGSVNALFTLFDLDTGSAEFPVSAGPAFIFKTGNNEKAAVLGIIRIEYDFSDIPLNLFLEGGAGFDLTQDIEITGAGAFGIRYIF